MIFSKNNKFKSFLDITNSRIAAIPKKTMAILLNKLTMLFILQDRYNKRKVIIKLKKILDYSLKSDEHRFQELTFI